MTLGTPLLSSCRIEIYGQHGACDSSDATVARAIPAILEGRLSNSQWNKFCDDLDEALKPAAKMRKVMLGGMIALPITFFVLTGISFYTFTKSSGFGPSVLMFPMIIGAAMFAGIGILMCVAAKSKNSISTGLRNVCDDTSAHPGVSFHVRYESRLWSSPNFGHHHHDHFGHHYQNHNHHVSTEQYIEVNIADATNNNVEVPTATATIAHAIPFPSAPPKTKTNYDPEIALGSGEEKKPPAERMRELNRMKSLLTEEEYQRKGAEIMSDV